MKIQTDGSAVYTGIPTTSYPTTAKEAYAVSGPDALWADFSGTSRTPPSRTTWPGPFNGNGEADVTSSVSDYDFPTGLVVTGDGITVDNFTAPYIRAYDGVSLSPNTFKFGKIGNPTGIYPGYIDAFGQDANIKAINANFLNCEIFSGVDFVRLAGVWGDSIGFTYCWFHDLMKLESSPAQGGGDSHSDAIQMNPYAGYSSSALIMSECRIDAFCYYQMVDGFRNGAPGSYDHTTEVLTPGTYWDVIDPSTHTTPSGLSKYDSLVTAGLFGATGAPSGKVFIENLYLSSLTYRYFSFTDGFKPGDSLVMRNVTMWKPPAPTFADTWEGNEYTVKAHGGNYAAVWENVVDRDGNVVPRSG